MTIRYSKPRIGVDAPAGRIRWGPLPLEQFAELISGPTICQVWQQKHPGRVWGGTLYRGSTTNATVDLNEYWTPHNVNEDGSTSRTISAGWEATDLLLGRTLDGTPFTLDHCFAADGLTSSRLYPGLSFFGAHFDGTPTTDCLEICYEGAHRLFGGARPVRAYVDRKSTELGAVDVGKATVTPFFEVEEKEHRITTGRYGFRIQEPRQHAMGWWLDKWVNPMQVIVSLCCRQQLRPSLVTMLFSDDHRPGRKVAVYVFGSDWPTLDVELLDEEELSGSSPLLLDWQSEYFHLGRFVRAARRIIADGHVPTAEYLGSLATPMTQHGVTHQFLSLVQSIESAHTSRHGIHRKGFDPDSHEESTTRLIAELKSLGLSSRKRSKIKHALTQTTPRFTLAERIDQTRHDSSLQFPQEPPPWLDSPPNAVKSTEWARWIADVRNDLAHGNTHHDPLWLRNQNKFLSGLVEFELLRSLGLGMRAARNVLAASPRS